MCAVDLGGGVMPDVTALEVEDGKIVATRPVYAGKLLAKVVCEAHRRSSPPVRGRSRNQLQTL